MQLTRPKIERTHVTLVDGETRKSRTLTVYGISRDELYAKLRQQATSGKPERRRPAVATA